MAEAPSAPIDLYYWPTPNGWKITILFEELGLPYRIIPVNIGAGDQFKPDFLKISPNNKMPAIVDPDGPGGEPISVFESGAILQYFGRKTGKLYPSDERKRVEVDEWLFWQMGGFGPMLGQIHHFRNYAPEKIPYAINRYVNEGERLYGVLDERLKERDFICGDYSIADIACVGWAKGWEKQGQTIDDTPNVKRWLERMLARPAVARGLAVKVDAPTLDLAADKEAQKVLFGQRARRA
ncbi:glutathione S-transferase N-terminal domain-containing protein [Chelatococcus sambhunathii]|uniref:Glutathione S-transferase N-terminal domain-containing protein n=1 Tax=Chelatococcus sambhunathii TaxID=363953 RepID=A0ABU1DEM3_9HYPH|nr:glutathione S-transferase N-terminal domain-containing protein [Chelatococcus sambhunathii]MDR4306552.1 glutathione S-transferase N-terminal domain-containing protein [Chelatococcus sambhunathii]